MSIILKGIDLPEKKQVYHIELLPTGRCAVIKFKDNECYEASSYDTRAIQIPKGHGAIKDINTFLKDKYLTEYIENDVFNKKYTYTINTGAIYNAPTILEAEE